MKVNVEIKLKYDAPRIAVLDLDIVDIKKEKIPEEKDFFSGKIIEPAYDRLTFTTKDGSIIAIRDESAWLIFDNFQDRYLGFCKMKESYYDSDEYVVVKMGRRVDYYGLYIDMTEEILFSGTLSECEMFLEDGRDILNLGETERVFWIEGPEERRAETKKAELYKEYADNLTEKELEEVIGGNHEERRLKNIVEFEKKYGIKFGSKKKWVTNDKIFGLIDIEDE